MKKIEEKKYLGAPTPPEDETISLFPGLLANPDMVLRQLFQGAQVWKRNNHSDPDQPGSEVGKQMFFRD